MKFEINFSKYVNERHPDHWLHKFIEADSKDEAISKLKEEHNKDGKKVNYIISIEEVNSN